MIKSDSTNINTVTKDIYIKLCFLSRKKIIVFTKILSSTAVFNIIINMRNVPWAVKQHISMISGGSCDTKDWSNDAENTALHHKNKLHLKKLF